VVTGISTGALIAPLALLGPRYDQVLADSYTTVHTDDIYRRRSIVALLWSESLADPAPLKRRIDQQVSDDFLAEIAQAHVTGRRLYVGTTNLDTGRLVVWDLGAIAAGTNPGKRELFCKILLASCAIPGLLPPVAIPITVDGRKYTELHVDGGVSASMFLTPTMVLGNQDRDKSNVYAIVAGDLSPKYGSVRRRTIAVSSQALQEMLKAQTRGDLNRIFLQTRLGGGRFVMVQPELEKRQVRVSG
jgi:predicted acylesterase/phospholipase RssA